MDIISLYVLLWRDVSRAADSFAAAPFIPALYVSARESTCRSGIYWAVATGLIAGNPSATGTYTVFVTAVSGVGSSNFTNFTWTVMGEPCPRC